VFGNGACFRFRFRETSAGAPPSKWPDQSTPEAWRRCTGACGAALGQRPGPQKVGGSTEKEMVERACTAEHGSNLCNTIDPARWQRLSRSKTPPETHRNPVRGPGCRRIAAAQGNSPPAGGRLARANEVRSHRHISADPEPRMTPSRRAQARSRAPPAGVVLVACASVAGSLRATDAKPQALTNRICRRYGHGNGATANSVCRQLKAIADAPV
jgi:hypothetical protein